MTTLTDVLVLDSPVLLTTVGSDGPSTRPVALQPDPSGEANVVAVLTSAATEKVREVRENPTITIAAQRPDGFYALEARAEVVEDPILVRQAMGRFLGAAGSSPSEDGPDEDASAPEAEDASAADRPATVLIRALVTSGRVWTIHSPKPFDSSVEDIAL